MLRLIAAGGGRRCYAHPADPALCIKVAFTAEGEREARREAAYLRRVERLHGPLDGRHLARLHGRVRTSHGIGRVFDRVLDERSGAAAPTLTDALDARSLAAEPAAWARALEGFLRWTAETPLVVRDLTPDNLCVRRGADGALGLVLIDGVGPTGVLPAWLPTRAYARSRNARNAARYGVTSLPELLVRAARQRAGRTARRGPIDEPVRLLDR